MTLLVIVATLSAIQCTAFLARPTTRAPEGDFLYDGKYRPGIHSHLSGCRRRVKPLNNRSANDRESRALRRQQEKSELADLMDKQERKAVKKYLQSQARKDADSTAKTQQMQADLANRSRKKDRKPPWTKPAERGEKTAETSRAKRKVFQQINLVCRTFSIDDVRDVTFEGSYTELVPFIGLPEIAIFGRSNVGKSSLLNCLSGMNKKVAVVSKTPGRTQQINLFKVHDSNGPVAVLVDLPGYGYAKLTRTLQSDISAHVQRYLSDRPTLRLAVVLMDPRREPQRSDLSMLNYFRRANVPLLVVGTKIDKFRAEEVEERLERLRMFYRLPEGLPVPFSSVTGMGKRAVLGAIRDACVGEYYEVGEGKEGGFGQEEEDYR